MKWPSTEIATVDDLLRACVVRIPGRGTGFFVAPGLVLTCAHLFRDNSQTCPVTWLDRPRVTAAVQSLRSPDATSPDLALLEISEWKATDHPCVSLNPDVKYGDKFFTWGHPVGGRLEESGDAITSEYEGPGEYIKAKAGLAKEGFSGSPLLNIRTAQVCGVVAISLDVQSPIGLRAVPVDRIFDAIASLRARNAEFHAGNPIWSDLLPGSRIWNEVKRNCDDNVSGVLKIFGTVTSSTYQRRDIEDDFDQFVGKSDCSAMILVGQSGMGKTTTSVHLAGEYSDRGHLCMFSKARVCQRPSMM